jgi:hypothetical protein
MTVGAARIREWVESSPKGNVAPQCGHCEGDPGGSSTTWLQLGQTIFAILLGLSGVEMDSEAFSRRGTMGVMEGHSDDRFKITVRAPGSQSPHRRISVQPVLGRNPQDSATDGSDCHSAAARGNDLNRLELPQLRCRLRTEFVDSGAPRAQNG